MKVTELCVVGCTTLPKIILLSVIRSGPLWFRADFTSNIDAFNGQEMAYSRWNMHNSADAITKKDSPGQNLIQSYE